MNISFHYYVVKTLAFYAGIKEWIAQEIATNSQRIDDFNLSKGKPYSYIYIKNKPPQFFLDHHLAGRSKNPFLGWWFYPVTTGISNRQSAWSGLSLRHEKYTIVPFHFIPPKPLKDIPSIAGRHPYFCKEAGGATETLMDTLLENYRNMDPMQFGMLLHTYACTYSHSGFSGFYGVENSVSDVNVYDMTRAEKEVKFHPIVEKSIPLGHCELVHVPDAFAFRYTYYAAVSKNGDRNKPGLYYYGRDNLEAFMNCAKKIYKMLCCYNRKKEDDHEWKNISLKFQQMAHDIVKGADEITDQKKLDQYWSILFTCVEYHYDNLPYFDLTVDNVTDLNKAALEKAGLTEADIYDLASERGEQAREYATVAYKTISNAFFQYNQFAYEHIHRVVGSYRPDANEFPDMVDVPE